MKITEKILDLTTGQETITEREATVEELAQLATDAAKSQAEAQAEATKAAEKAALLERLGITQDEAKLLLS